MLELEFVRIGFEVRVVEHIDQMQDGKGQGPLVRYICDQQKINEPFR
jgi:hypothetical protein